MRRQIEIAVHASSRTRSGESRWRRRRRPWCGGTAPSKSLLKAGIVRVIAGRREAIAEVAGRPVADAVLDVHGLQELERGRAVEVTREARRRRRAVRMKNVSRRSSEVVEVSVSAKRGRSNAIIRRMVDRRIVLRVVSSASHSPCRPCNRRAARRRSPTIRSSRCRSRPST